MRKQAVNILLSVTMLFCAFLSGFFFGRNYNNAPIQVSKVMTQTEDSVPAPEPDNSLPALSETTLPQETIPPAASAEKNQKPTSGLININTATAAQLETLPGIGEVIAQRIIDYRNANGPFSSTAELANVSGIGEKRLEDIWEYITVGG